MKTKYGCELSNESLIKYFELMINKIYKLLPMKEENCATLSIYFEYLMIELNGGNKLILDDKYFIELLVNLEPLLEINDFKKYRGQIFKCLNICKKIINNLKGVDV